MKHITIVTTSYPQDRRSGNEAAGSFVADFAARLSQDVAVTVVAPGSADEFTSEGGVKVRRFSVPIQPLSRLNPLNPLHWHKIIKTLRAGNAALDQVARTENPDHIFALWALPSGYWARSVYRRRHTPYSIWALGSDIWALEKLPVVRQILRSTLRDAQRCYADGILLRDQVARLSGKQCFFLPSTRQIAVRDKVLRKDPPRRLAFLGRWHRNKGVDLLLDALALLSDVDWAKIEEIRIAGGGPLQAAVHKAITKLQGQRRPVRVFGYLDKEQAADLYNWADYLVIPSRIESIPVIFSDAVKSNLPLIATAVGDLSGLLQEHHVGILAERPSAIAIATAIREALDTAPAKFGSGLEKARARFDLDTIVKSFLFDTIGPHS